MPPVAKGSPTLVSRTRLLPSDERVHAEHWNRAWISAEPSLYLIRWKE
jgi:hypothetical protein